MAAELNDLSAFVAVVRAGGFRDAARVGAASASSLSEAVRRLEARLGVRLLLAPYSGRRLPGRFLPPVAAPGTRAGHGESR